MGHNRPFLIKLCESDLNSVIKEATKLLKDYPEGLSIVKDLVKAAEDMQKVFIKLNKYTEYYNGNYIINELSRIVNNTKSKI